MVEFIIVLNGGSKFTSKQDSSVTSSQNEIGVTIVAMDVVPQSFSAQSSIELQGYHCNNTVLSVSLQVVTIFPIFTWPSCLGLLSQKTFCCCSIATKPDVLSSLAKRLSSHPNPMYVFWGIELFKDFGAAASEEVVVERSRRRRGAGDGLMMIS